MKRRRLSILAVVGMLATLLPLNAAPAAAETPIELFFSEYIEGSSFNKAIEIYNGTGSAVDLGSGSYTLELYSNGSASPSQSVALSGTIADGDVFVVAHGSAASGISTEADLISNSVANWNGDDGIVLRKAGSIVDAFGQNGFDPGSQWPGGSQNDTLRRMPGICAGDVDFSDAFDASIEWDVFAQDTFDGLGSHTATCSGGGGPSLVINEADADQTGTDSAEFVELYDGGVGSTPLDGLALVFYNGSDDKSYLAFDLDGLSTDSDGYFVLCGDAANTANCDLDVTPNTNLIQNGADAIALHTGDGADFPNDTPIDTTNLIDALVYDTSDSDDAGLLVLLNPGQPQVNERGRNNGTGHSNQRCPDGSGGARNTSTYSQYLPTPGEANVCEDPIAEVLIHDIQGAGDSSPLVGQTVAIEGIVVGDFQDDVGVNGDLNGFHVQEEDGDADSNPATSEGIFVFNGSDPAVDVNIGDLVRVEGSVSEFNGLTEMTSFTGVTVIGSGNPLPAATVVTLPVASISDFEAYEGMYVTFPQELVISEYFNFDRFGEIVLTSDRAPQPTAVFEPGSADAQNLAISNALSRITLDDGRTSQNADPAIHPNGGVFDLGNTFRGGDLVANATGVMDYSFGLYKIQPTRGADYIATNTRPLTPDSVGSDLTVATFNVLNYFTTLDDSGAICGPLSDQGCRGADNAEEFTRQRDKIIDAIVTMDADVVGLMEIENHPTDAALDDLVAGLNAVAGAGAYAAVATGPVGGDAIRVALIYKPASVTALGAFAVLDSPEFLDPNNLGEDKNRAALAQSFVDNTSGGVFTVAVNHLKSKGSPCGSGDDDLEQGSCNLTRTLAAGVLADWLETDPTGSMDDDFLIIGDLNSYDKEDPIDALKARGYADLVLEYEGEYAYSYVFSGQWGYLDYIMANGSMESQVTDATIWHINADEPDILDYDTSFKKDAQDALYQPNAFRSSDHDPVIIGLDLTPSQVLKETTAGDLADLLPTGDRLTDKRLSKAIDYINASLNSDWWSNENTIVDKKVFDAERQAIAELALVAGDLPEAATAIDSLLTADRQLALAELIAAIDRGGRESKIADAHAALDDAAYYISAGMYVDAVNAYKAAWDAAHKA